MTATITIWSDAATVLDVAVEAYVAQASPESAAAAEMMAPAASSRWQVEAANLGILSWMRSWCVDGLADAEESPDDAPAAPAEWRAAIANIDEAIEIAGSR